MALAETIQYATSVFDAAAPYLNRVIIALVIVLFGVIFGKVAEMLLRRLLSQIKTDERLEKLFKTKRNYARVIRRTVVRLIYLLTIILALEYLSLAFWVFAIVAGLALLVVIISLVLSGIDFFPNLFGGFGIRRKNLKVGDEIDVTDETGTIKGIIAEINLLDVRIRDKNGDLFILPNVLFIKDRVVKKRR